MRFRVPCSLSGRNPAWPGGEAGAAVREGAAKAFAR